MALPYRNVREKMYNELKWFNNWWHFTWGTEDSLRLIFKNDIRTWKMPFTGSLDHKGWRGEWDENWGSRVGAVVLGLEAAHLVMSGLKLCLRLGPGYDRPSSPPWWCSKQLSRTITRGVVTEPVCLSLILALCGSLSVACSESVLQSSGFLPQRADRKKDCRSRGLWLEMLWD